MIFRKALQFLRSFSDASLKINPSLTTSQLLEKVSAQYPRLYAKVNIFNFPFTVTKHDLIVMHRLKDVQVGDTLRLNSIRELGSPDFTIQGRPWISSEFCEIEACVVENGRGAKVEAKKPKKRKGHRRRVTIKPLTSTLLIKDIKIKIPQVYSESLAE